MEYFAGARFKYAATVFLGYFVIDFIIRVSLSCSSVTKNNCHDASSQVFCWFLPVMVTRHDLVYETSVGLARRRFPHVPSRWTRWRFPVIKLFISSSPYWLARRVGSVGWDGNEFSETRSYIQYSYIELQCRQAASLSVNQFHWQRDTKPGAGPLSHIPRTHPKWRRHRLKWYFCLVHFFGNSFSWPASCLVYVHFFVAYS